VNQPTWDGIVSQLERGTACRATEHVVFVGRKTTSTDPEDPSLGEDELNWIE